MFINLNLIFSRIIKSDMKNLIKDQNKLNKAKKYKFFKIKIVNLRLNL